VVASSVDDPGAPASTAGEPGMPEAPDEDASSPTELLPGDPDAGPPLPPSSQTDQLPEEDPHAPTAIETSAVPRSVADGPAA
jgi:hypothetical protein